MTTASNISPAITRDGDKTQVLNQAVATQIFSGGPGSHGAVIDGDGDWVVYHVVDSTPAAGDPDTITAKTQMPSPGRDVFVAYTTPAYEYPPAGVNVAHHATAPAAPLRSHARG